MEANKRSALLLSLMEELKCHGSWCGETHIQKATFFLQDMAKVNLGLDFILYKHGPFSFDLRDELSEMRANQLLEMQPVPPYGPRFRPTEIGQNLVQRFPKTIRRHQEAIEFVAERLGHYDVANLERLSTALLVLQEGSDPEEAARKLNSVKPHIHLSSAKHAISEIQTLVEDFQQLKDTPSASEICE